jgi:hypothetical protein
MPDENNLLAQEYLHIQKVIEDYDTKTLTVKAWSVSFSAVAIAFSYQYKSPQILLAAIASSIAFWVVEALIKVNQQAYYTRVGELEAHFSGGEARRPFQIARAWSASFHREGKYKKAFIILRWPHVLFPHVFIAAIGTVLLLSSAPRPSTPECGSYSEKITYRTYMK